MNLTQMSLWEMCVHALIPSGVFGSLLGDTFLAHTWTAQSVCVAPYGCMVGNYNFTPIIKRLSLQRERERISAALILFASDVLALYIIVDKF